MFSLKGKACKRQHAESLQVEKVGNLRLHTLEISLAVGSPSIANTGCCNLFPGGLVHRSDWQQNHRIGGVGSDLWRSLSPTSC